MHTVLLVLAVVFGLAGAALSYRYFRLGTAIDKSIVRRMKLSSFVCAALCTGALVLMAKISDSSTLSIALFFGFVAVEIAATVAGTRRYKNEQTRMTA